MCTYRAGGAVDISLFRGVLEQLPAELHAFLDTPIPYYFRYLFEAYPDALVIHQHRANVSGWYRSRLHHESATHESRHGQAFTHRGWGGDVPLLNIMDPRCARNRPSGYPITLVRESTFKVFGGLGLFFEARATLT